MSRLIDETGNRYGRLTVVERAGSDKEGKALWFCSCDCGEFSTTTGKSLRSDHVHSCGCLQREAAARALRKTSTRHGMFGTPEYMAWGSMKTRCTNIKDPSYPYWGGRGISICEQWNQFETFYEDMGPRPSSEHSLDRVDNEGDYTPRNCRWATATQQARNKRSNHILVYKGQTLCIAAWVEKTGLNRTTILCRLDRGWTVEKTLTTPI